MLKYYYQCTDCGKEYHTDEVIYLCPKCEKENKPEMPPKGVLKTLYDYNKLKEKYPSGIFSSLSKNNFLDILPVHSLDSFPYLKVGNTPFYKINKLEGDELPFQLYLKDESQNPTFSFKDRASNLVSAFAKENRINTIVAASTGNAGSSLAGICAAQNQKAIIFVPAKAPKAKLTQILMYGANIVPVDGTYDNAFDLSIAATKKFGWYNRNTAFNPFTIEGKKTVSFELFENLEQKTPDRIFIPVGDGVIISGVYKGFEDLLLLGVIDKMPEIIAVQAEGSDNISRNINSDVFLSKPSSTIADSISVDIPRNFYMAKKFIKEYNGKCITVSDDEIINASVLLSKNTGIFSEPAAATAFAGMLNYMSSGKIDENSKNIVLLTGCGLKDLNAVQSKISMPDAVKPEIASLDNLMLK
ncbi:MAG: threonine synthase [Bacteroidetes bacterium RIFOXYA12_FULL_35_11]|nr:MAG: threonine synthase [Bacteroidetes bacterium GWF2_35_48]OFY80266.1 MAG: threonine synthase [Bacteroidetes bacterium RIFOXYA12_FULL_35_11]OFZ01590.1 MAG: threonine synthase [Bacteroidetes bacterium RIFOXYC12_FULL_35_7]HBX50459.1 threonine synthase [Bacteroidales bacterium]